MGLDIVKMVLEEAIQYAATRNPQNYTEADIPRLIREVRSETPATQSISKKPR